mgnify:CR=1 FL=1|tara:strand:- start:1237 stop:2016 length:780 start_codon:yes stop_codon:yes gene_type:complete
MITSMQIGTNGRFGNQMFQYAAMFGLSKIKNLDIYLHEEGHDLRKVFNLSSAKKLNEEVKSKIKFQYREPSFYFNTNLFNVGSGTDLHGYFQSPLYFLHCLEELKEEFKFNDEIFSSASKQYDEIKQGTLTCSIHVRRTDYLKTPEYHPTCSLSYYKKAKNIVEQSSNERVKFLVFGDDQEWIENNLLDKNSVFIKGNSGPVDMCMMSMCNAHIIANSSFSWWAAMLGKRGSVIAPKVWFGPKGPPNYDTIYYESWVKV